MVGSFVDRVTKEGSSLHVKDVTKDFPSTDRTKEAVYMSDRIVIMTPRPGRVERTISVEIDRPRARSRPEFLQLRSEILQLLHLAG